MTADEKRDRNFFRIIYYGERKNYYGHAFQGR